MTSSMYSAGFSIGWHLRAPFLSKYAARTNQKMQASVEILQLTNHSGGVVSEVSKVTCLSTFTE
jgi:hypothetical protein